MTIQEASERFALLLLLQTVNNCKCSFELPADIREAAGLANDTIRDGDVFNVCADEIEIAV